MGDDKKRTLVIELFAQDVEVGLDVAVKEQRQHLGRFIEQLWDKYAVPLQNLSDMKTKVTSILNDMMVELGYR